MVALLLTQRDLAFHSDVVVLEEGHDLLLLLAEVVRADMYKD